MKNVLYLILMLSLFTGGCQSSEKTQEGTIGDQNVPEYEQSPEDIVVSNSGETNENRFFTFLENVNQGIKDTIRIVIYTEEGDPILQELNFTGEEISYTFDARRDTFGSGEIKKDVCQSIEVEETPSRTDYSLSGCSEPEIDTLIWVVEKS